MNLIPAFQKGFFAYVGRYYLHDVYGIFHKHVKIQLYVTAKSDQNLDPLGSLDSDPLWGKSWIQIRIEATADPQHWYGRCYTYNLSKLNSLSYADVYGRTLRPKMNRRQYVQIQLWTHSNLS